MSALSGFLSGFFISTDVCRGYAAQGRLAAASIFAARHDLSSTDPAGLAGVCVASARDRDFDSTREELLKAVTDAEEDKSSCVLGACGLGVADGQDTDDAVADNAPEPGTVE